MTLIAAYRPNGVPILLGDFLITYKGIADFSARKKIHKISSNFVVGWTGRLNDASLLLRNLFETFEDKIVTLQEVESFLTNIKIDEKYQIELILIGWVVEKNLPVCFLWDISVPTKIYYASRHVAGSGTQRFLSLLSQSNHWRVIPGGNNTEEAIYTALSEITELYRDETFERMNQQNGFGHGYELLYFNGQEFQYVENIAFNGINVYWDAVNNTEEYDWYPIWYRYHSIGDAAFLQITNLQNGTARWDMINPAFEKKMKEAYFEFTAGSPRANYYCLFCKLQQKGNKTFETTIVLPDVYIGPSKFERFENGNFTFGFPSDILKTIYQNLINHWC